MTETERPRIRTCLVARNRERPRGTLDARPGDRALLTLLTLAIVAAAPQRARAQVPTTPEPLTGAPLLVHRPSTDLDSLSTRYNVSDWSQVEALARDVIAAVARDAELVAGSEGPVRAALDLSRHHVALMWMGADAFGKTRLLRVVISAHGHAPDDVDLPGVGGPERPLTEVFLSRSPLGRMASVYTSTREDDPLLAQLPAFAQALAGPLFSTIATLAGRIPGRGAVAGSEPPPLWAAVKRVGLPFRRASVRLQAVAREPVPTEAFAEAAARLAASLAFERVPHAPCARALAATLSDDLPPVAERATCSAPDAKPLECLAAFDAVLTGRFDEASGACDGGKLSKETRSALEAVDEAFRELVQEGTSASADLDLTFKNRPPTHVALGAGAAVIATASLTKARVDTKNGVLVADPLGRVLTLAYVNWSPAGYDGKSPRIEPAERFRPFLGAVLTPDFGPAVGLNVLLVRGLGVSVGGALLFGKGADTSAIGGRPASPDHPYDLAMTRAAFVGLSYNFK